MPTASLRIAPPVTGHVKHFIIYRESGDWHCNRGQVRMNEPDPNIPLLHQADPRRIAAVRASRPFACNTP